MVSNVEPTVPEQPRLLGPCQSVAAGSSGRTTLVELGAPSGGGGRPVSGAMSLVHIWEGSERGDLGELGFGKCKKCQCLFLVVASLPIALLCI